jgi:hypothetical protein
MNILCLAWPQCPALLGLADPPPDEVRVCEQLPLEVPPVVVAWDEAVAEHHGLDAGVDQHRNPRQKPGISASRKR